MGASTTERCRGEREAAATPGDDGLGAFPFGPGFFLGQLRAFARDRCPDPAERLPSVTVHLASGEELPLCHVVGLAPGFVALAVREGTGSSQGTVMRTELVPYPLITRVTIRPLTDESRQVGFNPESTPRVIASVASPEEALRAAAEPRELPGGTAGRRGSGTADPVTS